MKIKKYQAIDYLIYISFCIVFIIDWFNCLVSDKSVFVLFSFLIIAILSFYGFISEKNFVSIDTMIYIFMFLFAYYAPIHQYITNANIHNYSNFSSSEYMFGNIIIIIFMISYMMTKKYLKHKKKQIIVKEKKFSINNSAAITLSIVCIFCLVYLFANGGIFVFGGTTIESSSNDTISGVITRIVRFFPAASVFLFISAIKNKVFKTGKFIKLVSQIIVYIVFLIVFNPIGGTMNRYILFGTFVMLLANFFENYRHKSYILLVAIVGFYFVFPAFNFFKFNSFSNISQFAWGGFDVNTNDYDSYQVFLQTIRYVDNNGITFGKNILSSILCIIPRSIWPGKSLPSGQLITEAINANFTNVSCPIFAEFYLAFGIVGVVLGAVLFGNLIKTIEYGKQEQNYYFRGLYYITVGIIMSFFRGAMLPVTSFWYCWIISFTAAYFICTRIKGRKV